MVRTITHEELKRKLDQGDKFRLAMAMDQWHFDACRIPGSISVPSKKDALKLLKKDEEIVVYCSDDACFMSRAVADFLERSGYSNVLHYAGGLQDWIDAGYPIAGTMTEEVRRESHVP
jgi:rhodanese-related sulfurtransferase